MRIVKTSATRASALTILLMATCAQAAVLGTYSDRGTWEGLVSGQTNIDFSGYSILPGGWEFYSTAAGLTDSGVTFTGHVGSGYELLLNNAGTGAPDNFNSGVRLQGPAWSPVQATYIQMQMSPVTALALELGTGFPNALGVKLELSSGEIFFVGTAGAPALTFWGVRADAGISWVRVSLATSADGYTQPTNWTSYVVMDNISYGSASTGGGGGGGGGGEPTGTPDGPAAAYVLSGLAMLGAGWRRRRSLAS
jgi:hypothetical protein